MKTFAAFVSSLVIVAAPVSLASGPQAQDQDALIRQNLSVSGYSIQNLAIPGGPGGPFQVTLPLGGVAREIAFEPHSVRAPGFKVMVQDASGALSEIPAPPETTYRGTVAGVGGAVVSGSLDANGLTATIRLPGGELWAVQPLKQLVPNAAREAHVVYRESDNVPGDWACGLNEPQLGLPALRQLAHGHSGATPDGLLTCELACDADNQFYTSWGSNTTTVTNDINGIINAVSNIYEVDCQIEMVITQIIIRTSAATNPYTSNAPGTLLSQFRTQWLSNHANVPRDLAHLFTGRNLDGSVIGIAYLAGICNTNAFGLSQSRYTSNFTFRTALTAHETGHNFNAQHCDSICSPCEIMCSGLGGCSGIVTSFSTCDIASITAYSNSRPCLAPPPPPPPPVLALPFFDPFPSLTIDAQKWPTVSEVSVVPSAQNERSEPNSMLMSIGAFAECAHLNTDAVGLPVFVSLWTEHVGVEAGKELRVKFYNPSTQQFELLITIVSDGVDQSRFAFHETTLPLLGFSETDSRIRLEASVNQFDDFWYVDDVGVSAWCRTDINKDRALTIADFGAFQSAFATGNAMIADFNDDGNLTIADFSTFQSRFAQGCY